jgi:hypothetical protein
VSLAAGEKAFWMVSGYAATSRVSLGFAAPGAGPADWIYNPMAKKFFHVEMDFTFVVESSAGRTPHDAASYSSTKHYEYVLEADEYGKILGGEWVGDSQTDHPDFAWWPTGTPTDSVAGGLITYAEVKALNDEAAGPQPVNDHVTVMNNVAISTSGSWASKYAPLTVASGYKRVQLTMTGTGDADLYVRKGQNPTIYTYSCRSVTAGTSNETCTVEMNDASGLLYVRARSRTPGTAVTVVADLLK